MIYERRKAAFRNIGMRRHRSRTTRRPSPALRARSLLPSRTSSRTGRETGGRVRVRALLSLEEMLAGVDLDAVSVCTPSGLPRQGAITALEAGKDVVIEKPVDVTLEAADRLIEAQRATGERVAVVASTASTLNAGVHEALAEESSAALTSGSADVRWWRSQPYYDSGGWRGPGSWTVGSHDQPGHP